MSISERQRKLFFVAMRKLGWTEDQMRVALVQIAGVTSVTELDQDGFDAMMGFCEYLGFTPLTARGENYGKRPGMASFAQLELIRCLWHEYTRGKAGEDELNRWLVNKWKVASLRFVTSDMARKMITALKAMKARAAA